MAIGPPRGKNGARAVYAYDPSIKRKRYVGSRTSEREARRLEHEKWIEFHNQAPQQPATITVAAYALEWLEHHHGPGTRRPAGTTLRHNEASLRPFLQAFGDRELDAGIGRSEALRWARQHPHNAKVVAALFSDAIDDEACRSNPFANRRDRQGRERKHIHPLTEEEVDRLAAIGMRHWGGYGPVCRAWILFGAWVGSRPGETFGVEVQDVDLEAGEVSITRVKRRGGDYPTDVVVLPEAAARGVREGLALLSPTGPMFRTIRGRRVEKGSLRYLWDPIRSAFRETVTDQRWAELLDGTEDGKNLDFYALRHFCASMIVARGGNEYDVAAQLGNSPEVAREVYVHSYREERNARNRGFLDRPAPVVDLDKRRRMA